MSRLRARIERLERRTARTNVGAYEVWCQAPDGADAYTSRAHGVTLTAAQLEARPRTGRRITVHRVKATPDPRPF